MELSLQTGTVADHTVLQVSGEVDVYTAPMLRERLLALVSEGVRHMVVDMARVEFLDSTGLGVLVGALKRIRAQGGTLVVVCNQERIRKIFRITGLERVFTIVGSVQQAIGADQAPIGDEPTEPMGLSANGGTDHTDWRAPGEGPATPATGS